MTCRASARQYRSGTGAKVNNRKRKRFHESYRWEPIVAMENLQVSLDDGVTWTSVKNIRVKANYPEEDDEIRLDITDEGVKSELVRDQQVEISETRYFIDLILKRA